MHFFCLQNANKQKIKFFNTHPTHFDCSAVLRISRITLSLSKRITICISICISIRILMRISHSSPNSLSLSLSNDSRPARLLQHPARGMCSTRSNCAPLNEPDCSSYSIHDPTHHLTLPRRIHSIHSIYLIIFSNNNGDCLK